MAGTRILIVDDDDSIRQVVCLCLTEEGYEALGVSNGQAALDVLDEYAPDLILLDLRMPVMDGYEFAERYRRRPGRHAPIVAFVAALNAEREREQIGANAVLAKPFDLQDLEEAISTALRAIPEHYANT
jgi:CheY-like chemotaxis protein